jgi:hypothetical protein
MNRFRQVLLALVVGTLTAAPASAASIGLIGGDFDPDFPFIDDPTFITLGACFEDDSPGGDEVEDLLTQGGFECAIYLPGPYNRIYSSDFLLSDGEGLIPYGDERISTFANSLSQLGILVQSEFVPGGYTLMSVDGIGVTCGGVETTGCDFIEFFSDEPSVIHSVSIQAVNRVPEPATLLMMGPAAAWYFIRRRNRNRKQAS